MAFPGSDAMVSAAERALGRRLPEGHRERLIRENGGEIRAGRRFWTLYPVWDATDRKTIARTTSHIVRENETWRRDWPDMLPPGHVAIADDIGGDLLVLAPDGDVVSVWDHETSVMTPVDVQWDDPESRRGEAMELRARKAILRATTETGQEWFDPSEDLLFILLSDIEDGDEEFLVVERLSDPTGQSYAQTTLVDGRWLIEYRDGSADRHFRTYAPDKDDANRILTAWAFELGDWRTTIEWTRVAV